MQYNTAYTACTIADGYRDLGYNALIIFDSLSNHAIAHRQTSLLLGCAPGREAYPADTFYIHAKLLERVTQLRKQLNFGSVTALPIVETLADNISAYIPTNIISITDGQIFLTKNLANSKIFPAVDIEKSVSRIGAAAQPPLLEAVTSLLKKMLQQYYSLTERKRLGFPLYSSEIIAYRHAVCAYKLCQQRTPRFSEETIILIIAAHAGYICPIKSNKSIKFILTEIHTKYS
jgi:F-type H+-transporting ATPase subunit alpha